jgi:hypothetical protein
MPEGAATWACSASGKRMKLVSFRRGNPGTTEGNSEGDGFFLLEVAILMLFNLRRLRMELIAAALFALALPLCAAEVEKYLPEDTEVILVVNAKQLLDSPLVKKHFLEHIRGHLKSNDEVTKILESLGFDPLKDVTRITVALSMVGSEAKGLIIAHGRFDKAKFEAKAEEVAKDKSDSLKIHKDGEHKFYEVKVDGGEKPLFIGVLDSMTIVASPEKQHVLDAFSKGEAKKAPKKELQELIEKADANQSLWFAATANAFLKGDFSSDDKAKKNLEKMHNITAGVVVDKGIKVAFAIATKSPANAKELAEELKEGLSQAKGLLALVAEQNKGLAPLVDTVGSLRVNTDGSAITLNSEISEDLLEKILKK